MNQISVLRRASSEPIREKLSRSEMWDGADNGLIWCWELGRLFRDQDQKSSLVRSAELGELPVLDWRGGVAKKLKAKTKSGSLQYLAQWQGMRGDDLNIPLDKEIQHKCSRTGQVVVFSSQLEDDEPS